MTIVFCKSVGTTSGLFCLVLWFWMGAGKAPQGIEHPDTCLTRQVHTRDVLTLAVPFRAEEGQVQHRLVRRKLPAAATYAHCLWQALDDARSTHNGHRFRSFLLHHGEQREQKEQSTNKESPEDGILSSSSVSLLFCFFSSFFPFSEKTSLPQCWLRSQILCGGTFRANGKFGGHIPV